MSTAAIPEICDCGGQMEVVCTTYYSHGPKQVPDFAMCDTCGREEDEIIDTHDVEGCTNETCGWCVLVAEASAQ